MNEARDVEVTLFWGDGVVSIARRSLRATQRLTAVELGVCGDAFADAHLPLPLPRRDGAATRTRFGDVTITVACAPDVEASYGEPEAALFGAQLFSASFHAALLLALSWVFSVRDLRVAQEDATVILRDRTVASEEQRGESSERTDARGTADDDVREAPRGATRATHVPEGRYSRGANPLLEAASARSEALAQARDFGMIGLLGESSLERAGDDGWMRPLERGSPGMADDADLGTFGGSGLSSIGEGSGASGAGIARSPGSRCAGGQCAGAAAFGSGRLGARGHHTTLPSVRCGTEVKPGDDPEKRAAGCSTQVNGRLPPEVVQRIVRQNFGRFRACYENGLAKNPSLEGRVAIKFVIDSDGSVSTSHDGGSDLPDASVVSCVVRAMSTPSFPEPAGGIVTVSYPLYLSAG